MDERTIRAYARMEDALERGPHNYGGSAEVAGLRAFRAYHPKATVKFMNVDGRIYWMTSKMMRVYSIVLREAGSSSQSTTITKIAAEARVSTGYASKVISRLEGWSFIRAVRTRGRWGGIYLIKVRKLVDSVKRIVSRFNVSSVSSVRKGVQVASTYMVETLKPFTRAELEESGIW